MLINPKDSTPAKVITFPHKTSIEEIIPASFSMEDAAPKRSLAAGLIKPKVSTIPTQPYVQKAADPIKSVDDIDKVCKFLIENHRYRDHMLFVIGINFGLRVSDLLSLKFYHLINDDMSFKDSFEILEKKTSTTRKNQKLRYISINQAVIDAVTLYLENAPYDIDLDDYLFRSESHNKGSKTYDKGKAPLSYRSVDRILKGVAKDCGINIKMSTHTLRKTFGYHQMAMSGNDPRKLLLLSQIYGHSSVYQTLTYIGITKEEMDAAYQDLNLGGKHYKQADKFVAEVKFYA